MKVCTAQAARQNKRLPQCTGAFLFRDWPGRALVGVATLETKAGHHVRGGIVGAGAESPGGQ